MRFILKLFVLAVGLCSAPSVALAQPYPAKPVRMVVPFPPGGAADILGRVLAHSLGDRLGQPVIVENRAGASGNIGAETVAKAQPDGHTLLMAALTSHAINYTLERPVLRYDLQRDLSPVALVATVPYVLLLHASVPARSVEEFVAFAKARPGHVTYGSSGAGAPQRLAAEMFRLRVGIEMVHVPYKGSGQVLTDLVGGQVLAAFESLPAALPHVRGGKVRALAVATGTRLPMLPEVPTLGEAALPGFEVNSTFGVLVPAQTAKPIIERLNGEIATVMALSQVREKFMQQGAFPTATTPDVAASRIRSEIAMWAKVIDEAKIKAD